MNDPFFGPPEIDVDEWRDLPLRHRYVHGQLAGTATRFSLYLPEPAAYRGRFLQFLQGGLGGSEHVAPRFGGVGIAAENGAYLVESNQGHVLFDHAGLRGDPTILAYRASAQVARVARVIAAEMYGDAPHHGYVFGGSGGANRSVDCLEHAPDVYDGAVPFMFGHAAYYHHNWSVLALTEPQLRARLGQIVDALDVGGTGDLSFLSAAEGDALATLLRAGYPRGAEFLLGPTPLWIFTLQGLERTDPGYFEDFWKLPGYEGHDRPAALEARIVDEAASVTGVLRAGEVAGFGTPHEDINVAALGGRPADAVVGLTVHGLTRPDLALGATIRIESGAAAGRTALCTGRIGDALVAVLDAAPFAGVQPGDQVRVDNRDFVAFTYYHRHLVDQAYPQMFQLFDGDRPRHPQRPFALADRVTLPSGRFAGRMIMLQHAQDRECWPAGADAYARSVRSALGADADDQFRLWWLDAASHFVPLDKAGRTRLINYMGAAAQAVRDVVAWVEDGIPPPASTSYAFGPESDLRLAPTAARRGGIQPVVTATANGSLRAEVAVGEPVVLAGRAAMPAGAGTLVAAAWDVDGSGAWAITHPEIDGTTTEATVEARHAYATPGTYFVTLRVIGHRDGAGGPGLRMVPALARVRVVVR